jgi:hypothetical protein
VAGNAPAFGILDSSVSFEFDQWQLSLYGRNLTDEDCWTHSYVVNPTRPNAAGPYSTLWRFANRRLLFFGLSPLRDRRIHRRTVAAQHNLDGLPLRNMRALYCGRSTNARHTRRIES